MPSGSGDLSGALTPKRANRLDDPHPRKGERAAQARDLAAIASR